MDWTHAPTPQEINNKKLLTYKIPILPHRQPAGKIEDGRLVFKFVDGRAAQPRFDVSSDIDTDEEPDTPSSDSYASWSKRHRVTNLPTSGISGQSQETWHKTAVRLAQPQVGVWPPGRESYAGMPYSRGEFRVIGQDGLVHFAPVRAGGAAPKRARSWANLDEIDD
jgi:hypothetical protein